MRKEDEEGEEGGEQTFIFTSMKVDEFERDLCVFGDTLGNYMCTYEQFQSKSCTR